jgi:hypothetical protein
MNMRKLTAIVAGGAGYVLGARAGRQRYEQIRSLAIKVKQNPTVQDAARQAATSAKEAAPVVKDKVAGAAEAASDKVSPSSSPNGVNLEDSAYPKS